ncbi:MAG: GHMP kinase [Chlorobi bacterium]|nr:GHMP kinase [Chlorobiota bacterium]
MRFHSNGKLLISGEYLVLKGALALALPVKFGQSLEISEYEREGLKWESFEKGKLWFSANFSFRDFNISQSSNKLIAQNLQKILREADQLSGGKLPKDNIKTRTEVDFKLQWGLGSSSTLISNVAMWAGVDPYDLHFRVSNGSGYDIACARSDNPVFFQNRDGEIHVEETEFNPPFKEYLYFVYLGKKQDSAKSVKKFILEECVDNAIIDDVSMLSREMSQTDKLSDFEYYLKKHEDIISGIIKQQKIKDSFFSDFDGEIKSLGAWGGDFALATNKGSKEKLIKYFSGKGLDVIFDFDEIVKQ